MALPLFTIPFGRKILSLSPLLQKDAPSTDLSNKTPFGYKSGSNLETGYFGQSILSWVKLTEPNLNDKKDNDTTLVLKDVIITANTSKNVIKTRVPGRSGTIKTYISNNDIDITLEVTLYGDRQGVYPKVESKKLQYLINSNKVLRVESPYLYNVIGVEYLIIEDAKWVQSRGGYSQQSLILYCVSDNKSDISLTPYKSLIN